MLNISLAMASKTYTFNSAVTSASITENSGTYTNFINYTPLWTPGTVTSAKLTLFLSDDVSKTLGGFKAIDIPREWAQVTNIRDGASSLGPQAAVEVQKTNPLFSPVNVYPLNTVFPGSDGFESPLTSYPITTTALSKAALGVGIIKPSVSEYTFNVTSLMNSSPTGVLSFDMVALNLFNAATLPPEFVAIAALFGVDLSIPQTTYEDFIFSKSRLTVSVNPSLTVSAVPEPSMYLMLALGLFGMFMSRRWLHRNN